MYQHLKRERRTLPKFARSIAPEAVTMAQLKTAVREELRASKRGDNPLTAEQYRKLAAWLQL